MIACAAMKIESILQPRFVNADYFLCKVKEFEAKYGKSWSQFFSDFSSSKNDRDNADYIEWAFLCRTFLPELIEMESAKSPPGDVILEVAQEPERTRAFNFGVIYCSICKIILTAFVKLWARAKMPQCSVMN